MQYNMQDNQLLYKQGCMCAWVTCTIIAYILSCRIARISKCDLELKKDWNMAAQLYKTTSGHMFHAGDIGTDTPQTAKSILLMYSHSNSRAAGAWKNVPGTQTGTLSTLAGHSNQHLLHWRLPPPHYRETNVS